MRKLLLVEDELDLIGIVKDLLPRWDLAHCSSALEAAEWLCENDPDVVLLDYSMTGIKSGRLQNIIRVLHPELPWLYFSGHTHAEAYHQALADNAFGFIEKPFDPIDLETKLEAALHVRRERRNLESRLRTLLPQIAIPLVLHSLHSCGYQRMPAKAFKELVSSIDSDK